MRKEERYRNILVWFEENMPVAETELVYQNPFELLVAVVLSAQCTDKRVNQITPVLLEKYPDADSMAKAESSDIFEIIKSCSYPNSKTGYIHKSAKIISEKFGGKLPDKRDDLQKLPGVGRKTANVILSVAFNKPAIAVDTHVFRVAERTGLTTNAKTPLATEKQLVKHIPRDKLAIAHHWLILHGRYTCLARSPKCDKCGIQNFCKYFSKHNVSK